MSLPAQERSAALYVSEGPDHGVTFEARGQKVIVGRSRTCDIVLLDPTVSRQHFQLEIQPDSVRLTNLSAKPPKVNGAPSKEAVLKEGDVISIGATALTLRMVAKAVPQAQTLPSGRAKDTWLSALERGAELPSPQEDREEFMKGLLGLSLETLQETCGAVVFRDESGAEHMIAAGPGDRARSLKERMQPGQEGSGRRAVDWAFTNNKPLLAPQDGEEPELIELVTPQGEPLSGLVAVPLCGGEGVLYVEKARGNPLDGNAKAFLKLLAQLAAPREAAPQLPQEAKILALDPVAARKTLMDLSRRPPASDTGWFLSSRVMESARHRGDFMVMEPLGPSKLGIILADINGGGDEQPLHGHRLYGLVRDSLVQTADPAQALAAANATLGKEWPRGVYAGLTVAVLDSDKGTVVLANAGSQPCYLWQPSTRTVLKHKPKGIALNLGQEEFFSRCLSQETFSMAMHEILFFASDGFTDAEDGRGQAFGEDGVRRTLDAGPTSPVDLLKKIASSWEGFRGNQPVEDDAFLMALTLDRRREQR